MQNRLVYDELTPNLLDITLLEDNIDLLEPYSSIVDTCNKSMNNNTKTHPVDFDFGDKNGILNFAHFLKQYYIVDSDGCTASTTNL